MPVIFQEVVSADQTYSFSNDVSNVLFDIHNDSPYNMGVSFGRDVGSILGCDTYTSPQSILYGLPAPGGVYSVGGSRFNGKIYLYTQTPLGGESDFSSSPAQSITVIGYPVGSAPGGSTSLNRVTNVGNSVPLSSSATSIANDANAPATSIVEATVAGDAGSAVSISNDAQISLGTVLHNAFIKVLGALAFANSSLLQWLDNTGVLRTVLSLSNTNRVIIGGAAQFVEIRNQSNGVIFQFDLANNIINFPQGGFTLAGPSNLAILTTSLANTYVDGNSSVNLQVGSTTVLNAVANGINCLQRINLPLVGGLSGNALSSGVSVANTVVNINHGLGANPDFCDITIFSTTSTATFSATWNATQIHVIVASISGLTISCVAHKY